MFLQDSLEVERKTSSGTYLDTLTGARAVAVIWTILLHLWLTTGRGSLLITLPFGHQVDIQKVVEQGEWGVRLFFALSGFLLSLPFLTREGSRPSWSVALTFYKRRALRILPAYYALLLVLLYLGLFGPFELPSASFMFAHTTFINFWWMKPAMLGVFWTLPVEITFYLLFPVLIPLLTQRRWPYLMLGCIAAASISRALMRHFALQGHEWVWGFGSSFAAQMDFFIFGMLAALCSVRFKPSPLSGDLWMISGASMMAVVLWLTGPQAMRLIEWFAPIHYAFYTPSALAIGVFVYGAAAGGPIARFLLANRLMVFIGTISFSLYLWHTVFMAAFSYAHLLSGLNTWNRFVVGGLYVLPPTFVISFASYRLIELPFLKIRHQVQVRGSTFTNHPIWMLVMAAAVLVALTWIANFATNLQSVAH